MNEINVVILNFTLYVALLLFCYKRYGWSNLSTYLSALYVVGSFFSLLLFISPLYMTTFTAAGTIKLDACLYLYTINTLLITSMCNCNLDNCEELTHYNKSFVGFFQKILCIMLTLWLLLTLPGAIMKFFSGQDLGEMRMETYVATSSGGFIQYVISLFFADTSILLLAISSIRIFLLKEYNNWDKYSIVVYTLVKLTTILGVISRATIAFSLLDVIVVLLLFKSYYTTRIKKGVMKVGLILIPILYFVFDAISMSRYDDYSNVKENITQLRYMGEANLNFMGLLYPDLTQPFYGYRQFPFYRRLLGMDYDDGKSRDGVEVNDLYISEHYGYKHPIYVFYGFAGTLYSNWGWLTTLLIAFFINYYFRRRVCVSNRVSFMHIVVCIILTGVIAKGIFYGDYSSSSGNVMILYVIYMIIKMRRSNESYYIDHKDH